MITDKLAHFINETSVTDIPPEAFQTAKLAIADFLGVALAGSMEDAGNIIAEYVQGIQGSTLSSLHG